MDYTTEYFLRLVESYLKDKNLWLPKEQQIKAAKRATYLFTVEDYSTEENAVEDAVNANKSKLKNFKLKISYKDGNLTINYLDGSDIESYEAESNEEIMDIVEDAIKTAVDFEEDFSHKLAFDGGK